MYFKGYFMVCPSPLFPVTYHIYPAITKEVSVSFELSFQEYTQLDEDLLPMASSKVSHLPCLLPFVLGIVTCGGLLAQLVLHLFDIPSSL